MNYDEVMSKLKALGTEKQRADNARRGAGDNQFGVKMGDLRVVAKAIKYDPKLAKQLWDSGIMEAMLVATLIMKPKDLSLADLETMLKAIPSPQVADWFNSYVVKQHPQKEERREQWMDSKDKMTARAGWSLTAERASKDRDGLDISALLDRIERELGSAPYDVQWTMNFALIDIGVHSPEHRDRAIKIGEKIGAFKDFPCSKGCVSPYAPIAIPEMAKRSG